MNYDKKLTKISVEAGERENKREPQSVRAPDAPIYVCPARVPNLDQISPRFRV